MDEAFVRDNALTNLRVVFMRKPQKFVSSYNRLADVELRGRMEEDVL